MKSNKGILLNINILIFTSLLAFTTACSSIHASSNNGHLIQGTPVVTQKGIDRNYQITGEATMKRLSSGDKGTTMVNLSLHGLHSNEKYPTHVHNLPCGEKGGGGHYQNEKGGKVDDVNEIWLTFTTDSIGMGSSQAHHGYYARQDAQSIVIHDSTSDKARIACIDLK